MTAIGQLNNGGGNESLFDHVKSLKRLIRKNEWGIFSQKQSDGISNFRKIVDETPVKTHMPKETLRPFHIRGHGKRSITSIFTLSTSMTLFETTSPKTTPSCTMK